MDGIRWLVDRLHVGTPFLAVARDMNERVARARRRGADLSERERQRTVRHALRVHLENRRLYVAVMSGDLGNLEEG